MIGERLSEVRKDHGDTQAKLAQKLEVSLPTVWAWEQEKSSPSHEALVKLCQLYGISSDYLLGLTDEDPVYARQRQRTHLTMEEQTLLREFEKYLMWRRKHK